VCARQAQLECASNTEQLLNFRYTTECCRSRTYEVDKAKLEARFKALQRQMHPDKHATMGKEVVAIAEQHSARINEGYGVLKCPLARAQYLVCTVLVCTVLV
jgi:hypothetical protein